MTRFSKVLLIAIGGAIVYKVASKIANKLAECPADEDVEEDIDAEIVDEVADEDIEFDEEAENDNSYVDYIFYKIRKGIKAYMAAQTNCVKEKINLCKEVLNNTQNRLTLGVIVLATGIGIGGGLIASAYVRLSE